MKITNLLQLLVKSVHHRLNALKNNNNRKLVFQIVVCRGSRKYQYFHTCAQPYFQAEPIKYP